MGRITRLVGRFSLWCMWAGALFVSAMTVLIAYGAIMRYLRKPTFGVDEITAYLMVGVCFLGLAYVLNEGGHITANMIVARLGPGKRRAFSVATSIVTLGYLGVLIWSVTHFVRGSYQLGVKSPTTLQIPMFIPESVILLGLLVFFVQLAVHLYRTVHGNGNSRTS